MKAAAVAFALTVVMVGAGAGPAFAQPAPDAGPERVREEARIRFQRGVQLFHEGSFEAALAEFRKAHQIAPSYRLLFNIAQVQYELHDYVGSLTSFKQYLLAGGSEIPADRRTQVETDIQKLHGRVAYLEITTNVDGAEILVDDVPVGLSPLRAPVLVNSGLRKVSVTKAGRTTTVRNVTVAGGDRMRVALEMREPPAGGGPNEGVAAAGGLGRPATPAPAASNKNYTKMWVTLGVTGALGVGAGVFALTARQAKSAFETELNTFPNTKERIDEARSKMITYAALTDAFAAAALLSGALTVYFGLSDSGEPERKVAVTPTLGGVLVQGRF
jgi:hypothetical protein